MIELNTLNQYEAIAPDGTPIQIEITVDTQNDIYRTLTSTDAIKQYYEDHGYVVLRNAVPVELCDRMNTAFEKEVQSFNGYIYRQTTSHPEKHQLSDQGYILNSIKHIQDMDKAGFPEFIDQAFRIFTQPELVETIHALLGDKGHIVQTMFFDGNPATPPHADSYYLDSANLGRMAAIWVALEDIHPGAGRFFVYPGSHQKELPENRGNYEISFHHDQYLAAVQETIRQPGMVCHAPPLRKGDVLIWNANTIHGSLKTLAPEYSRRSLTAHYIPRSEDYVLFQKVKVGLSIKPFQGYPVHCPKDPDKFANRMQMFGLRHFPKVTNLARKWLIKFRMDQSAK